MLFAIQTRRLKVISIRPDPRPSDTQQRIADLAFEFWLAGHFKRNGSPEESYLRAILELTFRQGTHAIDAGVGFNAGICTAFATANRTSNFPKEVP